MKKIIALLILFSGLTSEINASKVITVVVCGEGPGYWVEEQHQTGGEWEHHTLTCTAGSNQPCQWLNNPNTVSNFHNPVPEGLDWYDEEGNEAIVNIAAVNNAINYSIDQGNNSATIVVNNVTLHYSITPVSGVPNTNQIVINLIVKH